MEYFNFAKLYYSLFSSPLCFPNVWKAILTGEETEPDMENALDLEEEDKIVLCVYICC